ncbi:MAG: DUF4349 domain-containing protein [Dehalococcoidia bacterium]
MKRDKLLWGVLAAVLLTLVGFACGGDDADSGADDSGGNALTDGAAGREEAGPEAQPPAAGDAGGGAPDLATQVDRKVIFDVQLAMEVPDVQASFAEAQRLARNGGGYVESSSLSFRRVDGEQFPFATISLRVPADRHQDVLASLRGIEGATVLNEGSSSQEVTEEYTDLQSRLRNLERTEQSYLVLLERATNINDILTVNDRIDGVRGQIEQIQGRLNLLDNLADFATLTVSLEPLLPAKADPSGGNAIARAFEDAWETSLAVVGGFAGAGAYVLVAAAWLAPVGIAVLGGLAWARRRGPSAPAA